MPTPLPTRWTDNLDTLFWPKFLPDLANSEATGKQIRFALNNSVPDVEQIVTALAEFAFQFGKNPRVRQFINGILAPSGIGNNDETGQLAMLLKVMQTRVVYVRDPHGIEYVRSPLVLINDICAKGSAVGDCDDHVLLFNAMANSLGFPTRIIAVKVNNSKVFNHVISSVKVNGVWLDFDTCLKTGMAVQYPGEKLIKGSS